MRGAKYRPTPTEVEAKWDFERSNSDLNAFYLFSFMMTLVMIAFSVVLLSLYISNQDKFFETYYLVVVLYGAALIILGVCIAITIKLYFKTKLYREIVNNKKYITQHGTFWGGI